MERRVFPTKHVNYSELIGSVRGMLWGIHSDFNGYGTKDTYGKIVDIEREFSRDGDPDNAQKVAVITHYQENIDTALRTLERNNNNYSILGKTLIKQGYLELRIVVVELRR